MCMQKSHCSKLPVHSSTARLRQKLLISSYKLQCAAENRSSLHNHSLQAAKPATAACLCIVSEELREDLQGVA